MRTCSIALVNARVLTADGGVAPTLRMVGGRVASIGDRPTRRDAVVDCAGAVVAPGLVNAHDHLELNSFGRLKWRDRYDNVRDWIADFQPWFATNPARALNRSGTLGDRLFAGGLKNLLSGVTTVAHHNPLYRPLRRPFAVRVVRRYGWSHSLQIDGEGVADSYRRTPAAWPWMIHAAEGVDVAAGLELARLGALGCVGPNTVLVHGVALGPADTRHAVARGAALVWCPSSNRYLFGRTATVAEFAAAHRLAIGSDSRLSADGDLLAELRAAGATGQLDAAALVRAVTSDAARVLRLADTGRLEPGLPADLAIVAGDEGDPREALVSARRTAVKAVLIDGRPLVTDVSLGGLFDVTRTRARAARVDGRSSLLAAPLARRVGRSTVPEPGLEVDP